MPAETEIKLKIDNLKAFQRALKKLGAKPAASADTRVHEVNQIFDTPDGGLAKHGQLLRLRTETRADSSRASKKKTTSKTKSAATKRASKKSPESPIRQLLTFKSPLLHQSGETHRHYRAHKVREEIEAHVTDADNLIKIFEGLGMRGWFRYEKFRTTYELPAAKSWASGLLIELDETPIGTFVELEGPPAAIDRAAHELGFSRRDYILTNYLSLYLADRRRQGLQPEDMLFSTKSHKNN
jgi:adenylate cyclase class IV